MKISLKLSVPWTGSLGESTGVTLVNFLSNIDTSDGPFCKFKKRLM